MRVLQLTVHLYPNIGGIETHLNDLINSLIKKDFQITVLAYQPLTAKTKWKIYEKSHNLKIFRIPWIPNLFYQLVPYPILEFLYLSPGLFLITPLILLTQNPDVIHAHGLVAGSVALFWGKVFRKRVVISLHNIYHFPKKGLYTSFVKLVLNNADFNLTLSKQSVREIVSLGIDHKKVDNFTYWIDLEKFQRVKDAKEKLGWAGRFVVLFVGRLVEEKGVLQLLKSVKIWNRKFTLVIIGIGPLEKVIAKKAKEVKNIEYVGKVDQNRLPLYYSGSDILIIPSVSEEGFGRVIIESLACGTPVVGARRGAIPEALDETVGRLIDITPKNLKSEVEYLYKNRVELKKLANDARKYAEKRFSEKNAEKIISKYF